MNRAWSITQRSDAFLLILCDDLIADFCEVVSGFGLSETWWNGYG